MRSRASPSPEIRRYRPNAALAQRVRDRDRTCRFPGCGVAARRCDLDHVVPYPDGSTSEDNLVSLCRTHHGFKHHSGWVLTMDAFGTCTWTSPTGRSYVTRPADVRLDRRLTHRSAGRGRPASRRRSTVASSGPWAGDLCRVGDALVGAAGTWRSGVARHDTMRACRSATPSP